MKRFLFTGILTFVVNTLLMAQPLSGTKAIPGDYPNIQSAISALNINGVAPGGVTFNVAAGSTETLSGPTAGLIYYTCAPANYSSAASPVVFQKSGSGANPLITAFTPGSSTSTDGMIIMAGADYVTFDGIDLQENALNTTPTMQMEWGYALVKRNSSAPFDGCQYVTIRNCNITLNKSNNGSRGIHMGNHVYNSISGLFTTLASDANNNCKLYGNNVSNVYVGIDVQGNNNGYYDNLNEIGVTAGNNITNYAGSTGSPSGIYAAYEDNLKIGGNIISGGNGTTGDLYGIYTNGGTNCSVEIYGNNITLTPASAINTECGIRNLMGSGGSTNTISIHDNTLENFTNPTSSNWPSYLITQEATAKTVNIYNNIMRNCSHYGGNYYFAIAETGSQSNSTRNIYNNQIYNISISTSTTIECLDLIASSSTTTNIYGNLIHNIYSNGGGNNGMLIESGGTTNIYKNRIYAISTDGNGYSGQGLPTGIYLKQTTTANVYNNYITDITAPTTSYGYGIDAIDGIYSLNVGTCNVINNTVYLHASSTYTNFRTSCINITDQTSSVLLKNNIIVNLSSSSGSGNFAAALRKSSTSLTNYSASSDHNLFYAGIPSQYNLIYYDQTNSDQTMEGFRTRVSPREANSISELPPFVNAAAYDYHLSTGSNSACESGGMIVATPVNITDDYDGTPRYPNAGYPNNPSFPATAPDIGADEFAGLQDNTPPAIYYTALADPTDVNARTLTAMIVDAGLGVPVSGIGLPVLYWKKTGQSSYTAVQGVSIGAGQYTFTFGSGVSSGDVVYYYIAAQDLVPTPNVSVYPSIGAAGFSANPPAVSTPPSNPSNYTVQSPLIGIKSIPGDFPTIQAAIAVLNFRGVGTGGVTFNVAANYTETFTLANGGIINYTCASSAYSGAANPVVFQKSGTGANPLVTAYSPGTSTTVDGIISLAGADYVTFDGIDLQENPLNTTPTQQMEWGYALLKKNTSGSVDGCQYSVIRNCSITLNKSNTNSTGIYVADHTPAFSSVLTVNTPTVDANNNCKIYGNTISNAYTGIWVYGCPTTLSTFDLGNEIGVTAGNNITNFGGGTVNAQAIFANYQQNLKIASNTISGGNGTTSFYLYGICTGPCNGANVDIYGNNVSVTGSTLNGNIYGIYNSIGNSAGTGNTVNLYNNTVENCSNTSSSFSQLYGVYQAASANNINIYGNTARNFNLGGGSYLEGIVSWYGAANAVVNIHDNQVYNLTQTGGGRVYGIENTTSTTSTVNVFNNVVHGLSTNGAFVYGLYNGYGNTLNLYKNRVYDLACVGSTIYGMYFNNGIVTSNVYNNYVSLVMTPTNTNMTSMIGLFLFDGGSVNLFNNTVFLKGNSTNNSFGSRAVWFFNTGTVATMKNNIFVNLCNTPAASNYNIVLSRPTSDLTNYNSSSNNNLLYAGIPNARNVIYADNSNTYQTFAAFQALVAPRETNSVTELPPFADMNNNDLHIQPNLETKCESGGQTVSTPVNITDDFDGDARFPNAGYPVNALDPANAPDIGADEFAGGKFHTTPVIAYTPLTNPVTNNPQTLVATITDPGSGVPVSGTGLPMLYWKKKTDVSWTGVQAVSLGSNQYSFTFGSGVVSFDSVFYYVAAQGTWPIPNVGVYPGLGAWGFTYNPPAVSTVPLNPGSYQVLSPISGTVQVGTSYRFPTLTGAGGLFQALNSVGLNGNLTAVVQTDMVEPGTYALNQWTEAGAGNYFLNIQADGAAQRVISATAVPSGSPMININGADRVTINGGSSKYLLFRNTNSNAGSTGPTIQFTNGASGDSIKNCIIENNGNYGLQGTVTAGSSGTNFVTISSCDIHNPTGGSSGLPYNAIYSNNSTNTVNLIGNNISNFQSGAVYLNNVAGGCTITGNNIFEGQALTTTLYGIYINAGSGHTVSNNNFGGSNATRTGAALSTSSGVYGIYLNVGNASATSVQGNTLSNFGTTGSGSNATVFGLYINSGNVNVGTVSGNTFGGAALPSDTIRNGYDDGIIYSSSMGTVDIENNTVGNISYYNASNDRTCGIVATAGTVTIKNNTVRDIKSNCSGTGMTYLPAGIIINVGGGLNAMVEKNTVYNIWNSNPGSSAYVAAGIDVLSSATGAVIRNNKVTNVYAIGAGTGNSAPYSYGIYNAGSATSTYNNMVSLGQLPAAAESRIYGICDSGSGSTFCYFNSVYVGGTGSGSNGSFGYYAGSNNVTVKDNIFYNARTGGAIKPYAIGTGTSITLTSNYNDLFSSGTPLGIYGATSCNDLPAWRTASSQDAASISGNPNFVSISDLHINTASGSPVSDAGITIPGITVDFDYQTRNNPPDIGADDYTLPSTVNTAAATAVTCTSATLQGSITANNQVVTASFDWGLTTAYGSSAAGVPPTVTGNTATAITAALSALTPGTLYHYRAVGTVGIVPFYGADQTFTTGGLVAAAGSITGPASVCKGSTGVVYSVAAIANATTYNWSVPSGATITGGTGTNSITVNFSASASSGNISVYGHNSCGDGTPSSLAVTTNDLPVPTLSGPATACLNSSGNVYTTQAGMSSYSWTVSAGGTITSGGTATSNTVTVTWNTAGAQTVSVSCVNPAGCTSASAATYNVTVNALPVPSLSGPASVCPGSTGNVYTTDAGMSGYTWVVSAGGSITSGGTATSNTVTVTWNVPGAQTVSVSYTNANSCTPASPIVYNVSVNTLPAPSVSGPALVCVNTTGNIYTTQPGMSNYSWNVSAGGTITSGGTATSNTATITWNTAGAQTVTVNYSNGAGCSAASPGNINVTVNALPVPGITGPASACINSTGNVYTTQAGMTGYVWTVSAGGTITSGGTTTSNTATVTWNSSGPQTVSVSYTSAAGCQAASPSVYNVTVNPLPVPTISGSAAVCLNSTGNVYTTQAGMSNYSWSVSAGGTITSGGTATSNTATVTWTGSGAQTVSVSYTNGNGCATASPAVFNVNVNALPGPTLSGPASACINSTGNVYITQNGMSGYSWSVSAGGTITSGGTATSNSVTVSWNTAGPQTVTVSYTNPSGCSSATPAVYNVTVNSLPTPTVSGPASACINSTGNVYTTQAGMTAYAWSVSSGGTITSGGTATSNTATVTWNNSGAQSVSVSYTNSNGCASATPTAYNVIVNPLPVPTVSGPASACISSTGNVYTTQAGMSNYVWTVSAGGTITAGGTATSNTVTVTWNTTGAQTVSISYTNANGCATASPSVFNVTVNPLPVPTVTGPASACLNSTGNVYTTQAGMSAYNWTVSAGGTITSGGTSNSNTVTVTWNTAGANTVSVSYTNANGCTSASASVYNVTVNPLPVPTVTGPAAVCASSAGNVYTTQAGMTAYSWVISAGGVITAGGTAASNTVTVTWNTAGAQTVSVLYTNPNGCTAAAPSVYNVTVNPLPVPTVTGPSSACINSTGNVYTTQAGMSGYTWNVSAGGTITAGGTATSNTVTVTWNTAGAQTVSVSYTNSNGCTSASASVYNVTVSPLPVPTISGPASTCLNSTGNVYTTQAGMSNYIWTVSAGGTITSGGTATSNSVTVTWNTTGPQTVSVAYTNAGGCASAGASVFNVTVNPLPVPAITGPATACASSTGNIYTTQAGMSGYTWTVSAGGTIASGAGTNSVSVNWNTAGAQTVSVNYSNANGCAASTATVYNVTVNPRPTPTINGPASACAGTSGNVYSTQAGMTGYTWSISPGGIIVSGSGTSSVTVTWTTAGAQSISVNYTNGTGCNATAPASYPVTVNPLPVPTISGPASVCAVSYGNVYTTETGMQNYVWSVSAGGSITGGQGSSSVTVTWSVLGPQTISVIYSSTTGCSPGSPAVYNVTVGQMPAPTISGYTDLCVNSGSFTYTTESGMNNYTWNISAGGSIVSGSGTSSVQVSWNSPGSQWISVDYTNASGCTATNPTQLNVNVNPVPDAAGSITGTSGLCAGATDIPYTVPPITNALTYIWQLPAGATITSGSGTNSITVSFAANASSGNITVYGNNLCGDGASSPAFPVTVNALPQAPVISNNGDTLHSSSASGNQWYVNGTAVTNGNGQDLVAQVSGWYWDMVTLNGCSSDTSNHLYILVTGTGEIKTNGFTIYPVPNDGHFTIRFVSPGTVSCDISVINNIGAMIFRKENVSPDGSRELQIDLRPVPPGIYTLICNNGGTRIVRKIIVDR